MDSKALAKEVFADALEASLLKKFISKYCSLKENILSVGSKKYGNPPKHKTVVAQI